MRALLLVTSAAALSAPSRRFAELAPLKAAMLAKSWRAKLAEVDQKVGILPDLDGTATGEVGVLRFGPELARRAATGAQLEWLFSEGNGGEMRASFKGFPSGTGLIVHSPSKISINLMAIDIDERKRIDIGGSSANEDDPESQPAVLSARQAAMIECPCTRTLTKPR